MAIALESIANLKIAILSTPKTGNLWLKSLLKTVYDLPIIDVPYDFAGFSGDETPDRFIFHQHLRPTATLLEWLHDYDVVVLSTIRHPGDVLVSLFRFVIAQAADGKVPELYRQIVRDGSVPGPHTLDYVATKFYRDIDISVRWLPHCRDVVKFEELKRSGADTLRRLTDKIHRVSDERIHTALEHNRFERMRDSGDFDPRHFGKGESGLWRLELPMEIREYLRAREPYKSQNKALGYDFCETGNRDRPAFDPFFGRCRFDNGVFVPPFVKRLHKNLPRNAERWPRPDITAGEESFFAWLNRPERQETRDSSMTTVTNLMRAIYSDRLDLQQAYPDLTGSDRDDFCEWYLVYGSEEYCLDVEFLTPVLASRAQMAKAALKRLRNPA